MGSLEDRQAAPDVDNAGLAREWKRLSRAATCVALLTSPALYVAF
jgi:hypothetical protein